MRSKKHHNHIIFSNVISGCIVIKGIEGELSCRNKKEVCVKIEFLRY